MYTEQKQPEELIDHICKMFGITRADIESSSRKREVVIARSVFAYISKKILRKTFKKIGEELGGKEHSTIIHCVRSYDIYVFNKMLPIEAVSLVNEMHDVYLSDSIGVRGASLSYNDRVYIDGLLMKKLINEEQKDNLISHLVTNELSIFDLFKDKAVALN